MNILNILYTFHPGGVERLAIDVSNQLAKEGHLMLSVELTEISVVIWLRFGIRTV